MKYILLIISFVIVHHIRSQRVFYFQPDDYPRGELESINISPLENDLYVRQICIEEHTQEYVNCPIGTLRDSLHRVEVEFLLKNKTTNRLIYITNYPDPYETTIASALFTMRSGVVEVNPWYFSKFFIGEYDDATGKIIFKTDGSNTLQVNYAEQEDSLFFEQLTSNSGKRSDRMNINEALSPRTRFVKYNSFRWLFSNGDDSIPGVPLREDVMYVSRKEKLKGVFFRLSQQWRDRLCCYIFFNIGRLATKGF